MPQDPVTNRSGSSTSCAAPATPRTWKQRACAGILGTAGFVSAYVLSAGPVAGLHKLVPFSWLRRAIELYYAPIVWLVQRGPRPIGQLLKWYIDLFR